MVLIVLNNKHHNIWLYNHAWNRCVCIPRWKKQKQTKKYIETSQKILMVSTTNTITHITNHRLLTIKNGFL